jgi:Bpu10I restriction endonuclease
MLEAKQRVYTVQKSLLFKLSTNNYHRSKLLKEETASYEEGEITLRTYPTPHLDKLQATLLNDKLPPDDRPQVEKAIEHYEQWIANMEITMEADISAEERLKNMVHLLNEYRKRMDIDLIFDSHHDWLYRQKGQIKLDNSIIEEFLPRLINPSLIPEIAEMNVAVGPVKAFAAMWFDSSLIQPKPAGGLSIRTKDQDFAISKPLYLQASHYRGTVFERFIGYIRQMLKSEALDEQTVLERGYF